VTWVRKSQMLPVCAPDSRIFKFPPTYRWKFLVVILSYSKMKSAFLKIGLLALALFTPTVWAQCKASEVAPVQAARSNRSIGRFGQRPNGLDDGHGNFSTARVADLAIPTGPARYRVVAEEAGRRNPPPRAHRRRGKKLSIQTAKLPITRSCSPSRYLLSPVRRIQQEPDGPSLSRAPPSNLYL